MYKSIIRSILFKFDPEPVHHFTFSFLNLIFKIPLVKQIIRKLYCFCLCQTAWTSRFALKIAPKVWDSCPLNGGGISCLVGCTVWLTNVPMHARSMIQVPSQNCVLSWHLSPMCELCRCPCNSRGVHHSMTHKRTQAGKERVGNPVCDVGFG